MTLPLLSSRARFGPFVVDFNSFELTKHDIRLKLQDQPFQILKALLERPGQLVTREELRLTLWTESTFVDFDAGLNAAVRRLRDTLNDSAEEPRYIETLPRHGYRFIAEVEALPNLALRTGKEKSQAFGAGELQAEHLAATAVRAVPSAWSAKSQSILIPLMGVAALLILVFMLKADGWRKLFVSHASNNIQSLAVIPLHNLSGDSSQDYFADGVTDTLITDLAQIKSIRVISSTSSMQYKATKKTMPEIGKELGVDAVVEGSIVRDGSRVRITAQLIQASTDRHLWAKHFEGAGSDILTLEADVARELISEIHKLTPQENKKLTEKRTINPEAYDDVILGRFFQEKRTSEGLHKSVEYFEKAIALEPNYAEGYAGLAGSFAFLTHSAAAELPDTIGWPKSKAAALKALELDPDLAAAHESLGRALDGGEGNKEEAKKQFQKAIELDPNYSATYLWYSQMLAGEGHKAEALQMISHAQQVDPLNASVAKVFGDLLWNSDRLEEAAVQFQRSIDLDPSRFNARVDLADLYFSQKRYPEAFAEFQKAEEVSGGAGFVRIFQAIDYHKVGQDAEAEKILQKMKESDLLHPRQDTYLIAVLAGFLGKNDEAMHWLEAACQYHAPGYAQFPDEDAFQPLRSDPRFIALSKRMNLSPSDHAN